MKFLFRSCVFFSFITALSASAWGGSFDAFDKSKCERLLRAWHEELEDLGSRTSLIGINETGAATLQLKPYQEHDALVWAKAGATLTRKFGVPVYIQHSFVYNAGDHDVYGGYHTHPHRHISINKRRIYWASPALLTLTHEAVHLKTDNYLKQGHQHPQAAWAVSFSSEKRFDNFLFYQKYYRLDEIKAFYRNSVAALRIEKSSGGRHFDDRRLFERMVRSLVPRSKILLSDSIQYLEEFHRKNPNQVPPGFGWSWHFGDSKREVNLQFQVPKHKKREAFTVMVPYRFPDDIPEGHIFTSIDLDGVLDILRRAQVFIDGYEPRIRPED